MSGPGPGSRTIYAAVNDACTRIVDPAAYKGDNSGQMGPGRNFDLSKFADTSYAVEYLSQHGEGKYPRGIFRDLPIDDILDANPPVYYARNLKAMVDICRGRGIDVVLATFAVCPELGDCCGAPGLVRAIDEANEIMRGLAGDGVYVYEFADEMSHELEYWADGVHLNGAGAKLKAQLFARFIRSEVWGSDNPPREAPDVLAGNMR